MSRRFLLPIAVAFLATMSFADSTVNMKFLYPGNNASGGYYTYPYYFSVNGGTPKAMMCDAFMNHISAGESWNAHVTGLLSGKGLFGKDFTDYKAAGLIFIGITNGTISATTGNWAVWNLFDKGVTTDASVLALDKSALAAAKYAPASAFKGLALYTAVGSTPGNGPQEFIGCRRAPLTTPEPGTLTLLATGLIGMGGMVRRKLSI
jgi:hypothetical protein